MALYVEQSARLLWFQLRLSVNLPSASGNDSETFRIWINVQNDDSYVRLPDEAQRRNFIHVLNHYFSRIRIIICRCVAV